MKTKRIYAAVVFGVVAMALLASSACKSQGVAVTSRGQILSLSIAHPTELPDQGEDNLDVIIRNTGVNNVRDVLVEVELPPQLIVLNQTQERGIDVMHTPGSNLYRFTFGNIQPGERSTLRFRVRTSFGTLSETGSVKATAWQRDLPGDRLVQTALIRLRR
jgi:hypothetical protein